MTLSLCNDFDSFSALLDKKEPIMALLVKGPHRGPEFFSTWSDASWNGCPKPSDFERYKEMRIKMLLQSATPNAKIIHAVITQFEHEFITDTSENNVRCCIS